MEQKSYTGWIAAAVLAVIAIILAFMIWGGEKPVDDVLSEGYSDLATIRAEIAIKCDGPKANKQDCDKALAELSDILSDFSSDLDTAATSSKATTTTP